MKTLTITFHRAHNYGAVLQSYALQQALFSCGHDNKIIDYSLLPAKKYHEVLNGTFKQRLLNAGKNLSALTSHKTTMSYFLKFESFIKNELILTERYWNYQELEKSPPECECYLAGSDQLWNMKHRISPEFFLEFAPRQIKRVTYAVSMGYHNLNKEQLRYLKDRVVDFSSISVREKTTKQFIEKHTKMKCRVDIDPVFLLDKTQWAGKAVEPQINGGYILCYPLLNNRLLQPALDQLKKKTGLKTLVIINRPFCHIRGDYHIKDAGPRDFLGLFHNANYILTSSFHGTAFSMIMRKNFFTVVPHLASSRIINLLEDNGLTDRIVRKPESISLQDIDYGVVHRGIGEQIKKGYEYLSNL